LIVNVFCEEPTAQQEVVSSRAVMRKPAGIGFPTQTSV